MGAASTKPLGLTSSTTAVETAKILQEKCSVLAGEHVVVITGTTSGIGTETARGFCSLRPPPRVIMCNRDIEASSKLIDQLETEFPDARGKLKATQLDLSDLASVAEGVKEIKGLNLPYVSILVNNAGVIANSYTETKQGYELCYGVNHLAHFYLTQSLFPLLCQARDSIGMKARVVTVSSLSALDGFGIEESTAPITPQHYGTGLAAAMNFAVGYNQSKLCNYLFARKLGELCDEQEWPIQSMALHPATMAKTSIGSGFVQVALALARPFTRSVAAAASNTIYCSLAPELEDTEPLFYNLFEPYEVKYKAGKDGPDGDAHLLWDLSCQQVRAHDSEIELIG